MAQLSFKLNDGGEIPAIGFGTWQLSPEEAYESVIGAVKTGYRLIDTAKIYRNEESVGRAIKDCGVPREELFITTKLWNSDQGHDSALKAFDESLKKLGLDYLDLYLIHWPGEGPDKRHESWRAFMELQKQGKVKSIGVSNFTVGHLKQLAEVAEIIPSVNQVEFHPLIYDEQKELLDYCQKQGIVVEAYSPLARRLINSEDLAKIGDEYKKTPPQVMLRWAVQKDTVPLPRSKNPQHIKDNFEIFDFELTGDDMDKIDNLSSGDRQSWDPTDLP